MTNGIKRAFIVLSGILGAAAVTLGSTPCYFLQRTGCSSGTSGLFCAVGTKVCDVGYSSSVDTGCGRLGPVTNSVKMHCYTLTFALTVPCDQASPGGSYVVIGCNNGAGVCCYGIPSQTLEPSHGDMMEPTGEVCCTIKVER